MPAESSSARPQRPISTATRRASARSGVTRAIVRSGVSSASRIGERDRQRFFLLVAADENIDAGERALRFSWRGAATSRWWRPGAAHRRGGARARRFPAPARPAASPPRARRRARATSRFSAACGWLSVASPIASQPASSSVWSRPGRTTAPRSMRAIAARSSAVAGTEPVDPAAITGPLPAARRTASARISSSRRATGSARPASARYSGQPTPTNFRNSSVNWNQRAWSSGASFARSSTVTPAAAMSSNRRARSAARRVASAADAGMRIGSSSSRSSISRRSA